MSLCNFVPNNFLDDISVLRKLGPENTDVYLVQKQNQIKYVIKYINILDSYSMINASLLYELDTLVRLRNMPNIINLIGVCHQPTRIALVIEPMESDLRNFFNTVSFKDRIPLLPDLFKSLAGALSIFEKAGINHYDIKPDNILLRHIDDNIEFKVSDFGLSQIFLGPILPPRTEVYTLPYRPPEFLSNRLTNSSRSSSADIWAMAVTIVEYITRETMFWDYGVDIEKVLTMIFNTAHIPNMNLWEFKQSIFFGKISGRLDVMKILQSKMNQYFVDQIDPAMIEILSRMLSLNPDDRPTPNQILTAFNSPKIDEIPVSLPVYVQRVSKRVISAITHLSREAALPKVITLIAIEIVTRVLDKISDTNENLVGLASLFIATTYIDPVKIFNVSAKSQQFSEFKYTREQKIDTQITILQLINFQIYNPDLTPAITRAYINDIYFPDISLTVFEQPISTWFV